MIKSITYFEEKSIKIFEQLEDNFIKHAQNLAEYISGITKELYQLGLEMVKESLDEMIKESLYRRKTWVVEFYTSKQLLTSLGTVTFRKTLFTDKETASTFWIGYWVFHQTRGSAKTRKPHSLRRRYRHLMCEGVKRQALLPG